MGGRGGLRPLAPAVSPDVPPELGPATGHRCLTRASSDWKVMDRGLRAAAPDRT